MIKTVENTTIRHENEDYSQYDVLVEYCEDGKGIMLCQERDVVLLTESMQEKLRDWLNQKAGAHTVDSGVALRESIKRSELLTLVRGAIIECTRWSAFSKLSETWKDEANRVLKEIDDKCELTSDKLEFIKWQTKS